MRFTELIGTHHLHQVAHAMIEAEIAAWHAVHLGDQLDLRGADFQGAQLPGVKGEKRARRGSA